MKILHVSDTSIYNFDGISTYINELLQVANEKDDESMVLTTSPFGTDIRTYGRNKNVSLKTFKSFRFPGKPKFIIVFPFGIKKTITKFKPDIIWIHTIGTIATQTAKFASGKYKVVYTKHCFDGELWNAYLNIPKRFQWFFNWTSQNLENKILKAANDVIFHLTDFEKVKNNKYFYKYRPISPPLNSRFFKTKNSIKNSTNIINLGFCGRAEPDKGIELTFLGLKILKDKYKIKNFSFTFIGDGPEAHRMKNLYPDMDIRITGYINDVIPHLDTLDAFILSSLQETISLSSLEAYSRGIPIFSVAIGYLYEFREQLVNYFIFDNAEKLADLLYNKVFIEKTTINNTKLNKVENFLTSYTSLHERVTQNEFSKVEIMKVTESKL